MAGIKDYSSTAANNSSVGGVSIAEGMLPSNINNAFRAITADIREFYNDSQWVIYGDGDGAHTFAYASGTSFTIAGANVTSVYHANRRIKAVGSSTGTIVGTISSSSFSTNTTVNVTWDSGSLQSETLVIYLAALSQTNNSIPLDVIDSGNLKSNAVTTAKITNAAVTGDKLASTLDISGKTVTLPDGSVATAKLAADAVITSKITDANVTTAKIADSNVTTAKIADDAVTAAKIADAVLVTNSEHSGHSVSDTTLFTTSASDARYFRQDSTETISSGDTWSSGDTKIATTGAINARIVDLIDDVGGFVPIDNETSFPATNPGAGVLVSIQAIGSTRTPSTGTVTISNGQGSNTVTINNVGTTVLTAGFGAIVEATSTLNTYDFHRLQPKATEVSTVATNVTNVNTVATNISNVNSVASNATNINTTATNITDVNTFANRYRIASSAPTSSLDVGDLYFDTTANELKVYKSSGWAAAGSSVNGTSERFTYTASGGQTTFTGNDLNSNNLTYDSPFIDVYLNGVKLVNGTDCTVTSGSSVVLASGATAGDTLDLVTYGTFNVAAINAANITSGTLNNARLPSTISDKTIQATALTAKGDGSSADGKITLNCSQNSHGVAIQSPAHSAGQSYTLILPTSVGSSGQVLATAGSSTNQLSWVTATETKPTVANVSQTIAPATATTINITGTNFSNIPQVEFINSSTGAMTLANTVSLTNATTLSVNCTLASGTYYVRIELDDGNAGRSANAIITASTAPTFSTAAGSIGTIAGNFSGTVATVAGSSDSTIAFSEVTSVLTASGQANCTLNSATGVITTSDFGGTSTTPTTYNFTLRITDAEGQTVDRAFSLTSSFGASGGGQFN
jgi:hypothetical protein